MTIEEALTDFLRARGTNPRLLALGEPTHGDETFLTVRNQLFRYLVGNEGYRSIAIESDVIGGLALDEYVSGNGDYRDGFSHGFGAYAGNRELVEWMRAYNGAHPGADRLRFFGFDAPMEMMGAFSPRAVLSALHSYLAAHLDPATIRVSLDEILSLAGEVDDRWSNPEAAMDPSKSIGGSPEAIRLRLIADDLAALLRTESPRLIPASSPDEWWRARLYARSATGLLRYHAAFAVDTPNRVSHLAGLRDAMMADNLEAIAKSYGPTMVFAHNGHLQRAVTRWDAPGHSWVWWSAGSMVSAGTGRDGYAFIATALGTAGDHAIEAPPPDDMSGCDAMLFVKDVSVDA